MPSKPSKADTYLFHIRDNITLANSFVEGLDYARFRDSHLVFYAVTRALEIISEASRRLPDDLKARHPSIAWKDMAGAGNIYRHDYEDVAARHVWDSERRNGSPLCDLRSKRR